MAAKNDKAKAANKRPHKLRGPSLGLTIFNPTHNGTATPDGSRNLTVNGWVGLVAESPSITAWFIYNNSKYISTAAPILTGAALPNPNWSVVIPNVPVVSGGFDCTLTARAVLPDSSAGGAPFDVTDSITIHITGS